MEMEMVVLLEREGGSGSVPFCVFIFVHFNLDRRHAVHCERGKQIGLLAIAVFLYFSLRIGPAFFMELFFPNMFCFL